MIKRRFYKQDYGDKSDDSSSSDSDSDSESISEEDLNAGEEGEEEESCQNEEEEDNQEEEVVKGSGYESEDSSANEIVAETSDLLSSEEEDDLGTHRENLKDKQTGRPKLGKKEEEKETKRSLNKSISSEDDDYVLRHKCVFKCRICPRVVCLSMESLTAHLKSKGHARAKKLHKEGRLKLMLNSDGELEEEEETHAERHARLVSLAQITSGPIQKNRGRQRQAQRRKEKLNRQLDKNKTNQPKAELEMEKSAKKKRKIRQSLAGTLYDRIFAC